MIQRWTEAGARSAVFILTNEQRRSIFLSPYGRLNTEGEATKSYLTPVLNSPSFSVFCVPPGDVATIEVAVIQNKVPWQLELYYIRDAYSDSFLRFLRMLPEPIRRRITSTAAPSKRHTLESEWINRPTHDHDE